MSVLVFSNLAVEFEHNTVSRPTLFQNISASLNSGITALIGVNGIGKSVLLKVLAGDIPAAHGQIVWSSAFYRLDQLQIVSGPRIADALGVGDLFDSFQRIEQAVATSEDFDKVADHWHEPANWQAALQEAGLQPGLDVSTDILSGGQRVRLALCAAFMKKDHYLLLDEPGNHLDTEGRQWLARCLQKHNAGVLMVSHDPGLLELASAVLLLDQHGLGSHGSYQDWLIWRSLQQQALERRVNDLDRQTRMLAQEHQENLRKSATRRQRGLQQRYDGSQGRLLLDARAEQAQRSAAREQLRHQQHEQLLQGSRQQLRAQRELLTSQKLPMPAAASGSNLLFNLRNVELPFGNRKQALNWTVRQGERWRLSGPNGSGKSSLLKVLAGLLDVRTGDCSLCSSAVYLDQHVSLLEPADCALDNLMRLVPGRTVTDWRTWLGSLRLGADKALLPVSALSGGERLKVALLALSSTETPPQLLLLDEPDNHLDIDSRELLAESLRGYQGAIVLVSHQQSFVDTVLTEHEFRL